MTIQQKTAFIFTGITATILLSVSFVAYFFMNVFAFQDYYKRLEIRGIFTAKAQLEHPNGEMRQVFSAIREEHLEPLPNEQEFFFPADSLQAFIASKSANHLPSYFFAAIKAGHPSTFKANNVFYTGLLYHFRNRDYIVIIGAENAESIRYARKLRVVLLLCCLVGTAIAYTSGIFFSRHTFKPVRDIIDRVKTIGAENLHERLEARAGEDEIAEITSTFNEMLSRLETAFETQNNFISNASHELRTPLTAICGEAEIALSRERDAIDYRHSLQIIVGQAEKLQHLTNSLLNLAQTGFDGKKQNFTQIRIDELLTEVKLTLNNIIPDNKIQITLQYSPQTEEDLVVTGNYQLLKLGFSNVMENACKYSDNKPVSVTLNKENQNLTVTIHDYGIGIPRQELKHIYDPFFRASNTGRYEGYGIGLPLTRNIFRLHKGSINVQSDANEGTTVILSLPAGKGVHVF